MAEQINDIETLKRSIAGLRGENTKLKRAINARQDEIFTLEQELDDAETTIKLLKSELNKANEKLHEFAAMPWYKRLFV